VRIVKSILIDGVGELVGLAEEMKVLEMVGLFVGGSSEW
jgi:hypothetical protein